jgi:plastocyanin
MKKAVAENDQIVIFVLAIILAVVALWAIGCGGGGGGSYSGTPTAPSGGSGGGNVGATVTLTANGVSDATPRINSGDRVRFINNDTRMHQILSTPHGAHTDCPALNSIGSLAPGASGTSDALTGSRGCGFHDHMNPDDNKFRGQVLVGLSSGEPPPPTPGYLRR